MGIEYESVVDHPLDEVFAWHTRPGAMPRLVPPWQPMTVVSETRLAGRRARGAGSARRVALGGAARPAGVRPAAPVRRRTVVGRAGVVAAADHRGWRHTHDVQRRGGDGTRVHDRIDDARSPPRRCGRRSSTGIASSSTTSLPTATPPTRASSRWSSQSPGRPGWSGRRWRVAHHGRAPGDPAGPARSRRRTTSGGGIRERPRPTCWRRRRGGAPGRGVDRGPLHRSAPDGRSGTAGSSRPAGSPRWRRRGRTGRVRSSAPRRSASTGSTAATPC